jgi:DNA-binding LacI/PurR family transcriptional regulator
MPRLPKRQHLSLQAAGIIEEMITTGELRDLIPGERTLAEKLQIGRDTLRASLEILEQKKVISKRQHGKRRSILKQSSTPTRASTRRVAFLSPKNLLQLPPKLLAEFDTLRELLQKQSYELELVSPGVFHLQNPSEKLKTLVKDHEADLWILYQCDRKIQEWFCDNQIPTLVRGFSHDAVDLPCIDDDWRSAAFHAGLHLKRMGHSRIGLLMPDTKLAGLRATEAGLQETAAENPESLSIHKMTDSGDLKSVTRALEIAFGLDQPPTALVATRSRHVLTLFSWLAAHRLAIPHDLSLITLSSETWFDHLVPSLSHYRSDPIMMARSVTRKVLQLAEGETSGAKIKLLVPEFFDGGSVKKLTRS